jgi:hypothetical protein
MTFTGFICLYSETAKKKLSGTSSVCFTLLGGKTISDKVVFAVTVKSSKV